MTIENIQVLSGPNYWSLRPCIQMRLDIGQLEKRPTSKLDQFYERLKETLPSLYDHRCSVGTPGGFFERVKDGTWMGHVVEHVALELQTLAEMDTGFGRTRETKTPGVYNVVFSYVVSEVGKRAGKLSVDFCESLIDGKDPKLDKIIQELKELREEYKLGPSTSSIVDEAVKRGIPFFRLNRGSLVQLGYGKNQELIRATMTSQTGSLAVDFAQDKWETKSLLECQGIPVPKGVETSRYGRAKDAVKKIGYPLVVKPSDGNHGRGITVGVNNNDHFEIAYEAAMKQSKMAM
jgi:cyanophycin synthetase